MQQHPNSQTALLLQRREQPPARHAAPPRQPRRWHTSSEPRRQISPRRNAGGRVGKPFRGSCTLQPRASSRSAGLGQRPHRAAPQPARAQHQGRNPLAPTSNVRRSCARRSAAHSSQPRVRPYTPVPDCAPRGIAAVENQVSARPGPVAGALSAEALDQSDKTRKEFAPSDRR